MNTVKNICQFERSHFSNCPDNSKFALMYVCIKHQVQQIQNHYLLSNSNVNPEKIKVSAGAMQPSIGKEEIEGKKLAFCESNTKCSDITESYGCSKLLQCF